MVEDRSEGETLGIPSFVIESNVWDTPLWYYGFVVALLTYVVVGVSLVLAPVGAFAGFETLVSRLYIGAWFSLPILLFFDAIYVSERRNWSPDVALWTVSMIVWVANVGAAVVYLHYRRQNED